MSERGKFIVVGGIEATDKAFHVERLSRHIGKAGLRALHFKEFEGTLIADTISPLMRDAEPPFDTKTNTLLATLCRLSTWGEIGERALERGEWVLSDNNWYRTLVEEGYGRGASVSDIEQLTKEHMPPRYLKPDMTILLTIQDEAERERRIIERVELEHPDTFESKDAQFQQKLHFGYTQLAQRHEVTVVDASGSKDEVEEEIFEKIKPLLPKHAASN